MKLFRVILSGMHKTPVSIGYGEPFVVADSPNEALKKVQDYLKENDLGFKRDRVMNRIELLAEDEECPSCGYQLFL